MTAWVIMMVADVFHDGVSIPWWLYVLTFTFSNLESE